MLGWALEKAGQSMRIQNSVITSGEGWTAGEDSESCDQLWRRLVFLNQVLEELSVGGVVPRGIL